MSFFNKERHFSLFNADSYHYSQEHCLFKGKFDFLDEQGGGYADKDRGYGFSGFITWGAGGTFIWDRYALFYQKSCRGYGP